MMEIKDTQGNILLSVPLTVSAVKVDELMKQHNISLQWESVNADELPLGAYIEHEGVRYILLEPYMPSQKDELVFEYKPVFHHPVMRWQHILFFFYTYSNGSIISKELDWSLTDNPANFMSAICDALFNETGVQWTYALASDLPVSASVSFSSMDIFSALNSIASAFETEWWFDWQNKVLHLSQAVHGEAVTLEVGKNIGVPSATQSKEDYATRFYVFGSTRNISQDYAGSNVNSVVNKRLTLNPEKYPNGYIDIREGLTESEILDKPLVFDDIYPRSALTISDVKVRKMWRLDEDNNKIPVGKDELDRTIYDQYAIWYFRIPNFSFSNDMLISGKALSVHFNSGPLTGREFELTYHDKDKEVSSADGDTIQIKAGDYEINFQEDGTYIIPAISGLVPAEGNEITLFNLVMPEEYRQSAYEELEQEALKAIAKRMEDLSSYSFSSNPIEFYNDNPNLSIGSAVTYKNGDYSFNTRVIKLETQMDYPWEQKITVGNPAIKGNTQELKEEVFNANQNIDLLAAINESTASFQQALQRAQKLTQESISKYGEWFTLRTLENGNKILETPHTFVSKKNIVAGQIGDYQGGEEGGQSYNRLDRWEDYNGDAGDVLSAVLGYDLKKQIEELRESGGGEVVIGDITIKVGEKTYEAENGVVTLPAYPKNVSELGNDANYLTEDKAADTYAPKDTVNSINSWFSLQRLPNGAAVLVTPHNIVSEKNISSGGIGENMIAPSILREWADYDAENMFNHSLSAKLGVELYEKLVESNKWKVL